MSTYTQEVWLKKKNLVRVILYSRCAYLSTVLSPFWYDYQRIEPWFSSIIPVCSCFCTYLFPLLLNTKGILRSLCATGGTRSSIKGKFHDHFFRRKAQNFRAEKVLGMRIEILIFSTKKIALRQWVVSIHWRNKKAKPIKFKHFYKKPLTSLFQHFSKSKQDGDTEHTFCCGMYSSGNIAPSKNCAPKICS